MHLQTQHDAPVESKSCKLLEPFSLIVKEILKTSLFFLMLIPLSRLKNKIFTNAQLFFASPLEQHPCLYFDNFSKPHFLSC